MRAARWWRRGWFWISMRYVLLSEEGFEGVVGVGEGVGGWNQSLLLLLLEEGRVVLRVSFGWPWAWGWDWDWDWDWV